MAEQTRYKILDNFKDLKRLVAACKETGYACVDFETTGTEMNVKGFIPTILSVTFQAGSSIIIPLAHEDSPFKHKWLKVLKYFGTQVIENPDIVKMAWNWKFDSRVFKTYGIQYRGTILDGMLAKYALNEERPNGLKPMVERYLPKYAGYENDKGFDKIPWDRKPFLPLCEYAAIDTDATFQLTIFFESKLIEAGLYGLFRNLLMPASRVLSDAEFRGLHFNRKLNDELHIKYEKLIKEKYAEILEQRKVRKFNTFFKKEKVADYIENLEKEIEELSKEEGKERMIVGREQKILKIMSGNYTTKKELALLDDINLGSFKQLGELLYTHPKGFQFPIIDYTEKGAPATGEDAILKLIEFDKGGFIQELINYRGLTHAYSTFISGYRELIQDDEKIHGSFNIHMTVTGRLSSNKPNLQQIPKKEVNPDIKPQFTCPPGQLFLAWDYSQAELRVLAYLAKDKSMIQWFREGRDIHLASACTKYGIDYDDAMALYSDEMHKEYVVWKERRKNAKITNFGAVYGVSAKKLAVQLSTDVHKVSESEAQEFLDHFFEDFEGIARYMKRQVKRMEKHGYVETLFGRKRRCPDIYSDHYGKYLEASRQSYNAPSQSAASDTALFASVILHEKVKTGEMPMINEVSTVHDSVYTYTFPSFINPWTIYQLDKIFKRPPTKKYFGFEIIEPKMAIDYSVGRNMLEEWPYIPGYDYDKLLQPGWTKEAYFKEKDRVGDIDIEDYPKHFPEYFTKKFIKTFRNQWQNKFNSL